jgi:oligopeptidase B
MLSHIKQTDVSVPLSRRRLVVLLAHRGGAAVSAIHCRKADGRMTEREQVILDGNALAEGHSFMAIGDTDITDDGRWLAYSVDTPAFASTRCTSRI